MTPFVRACPPYRAPAIVRWLGPPILLGLALAIFLLQVRIAG